MDPIKNPYSPGAGSPPPELVGRDGVLEQARVLFGRTRLKRSEKSLLLTGLRGVGKTVLLNEIECLAKSQDYRTLVIEAYEDKALGPLLAQSLRGLLFELDRVAGTGDKVKRGLRVLRSFLGTLKVTYNDITFSLDIDPETGAADTGDLAIDLPNLFVAVAEAAEERSRDCVAHRRTAVFQRKLVWARLSWRCIGAAAASAGTTGRWVANPPGACGRIKSYAERLFMFPDIGALSKRTLPKRCGIRRKAPGRI